MLEVKSLLARWSKFYWSPLHPNHYVMDHEDRKVGIGLIASRNYAAFNYAWAVTPNNLPPLKWQTQAVIEFTKAELVTDHEVDGGTIGWHLTGKSQKEFVEWYSKTRSLLPESCKIFDSISNEQAVHTLRRL